MNTPNPLVPQGSFPSKGKSTVRIAFFTIAAIHVVFIGGLLMQGCKKPEEKTKVEMPPEPTNALPPFSDATNVPTTNEPVPAATNTQPAAQIPPEPLPPVATPGSEYVVVKNDNFSSIAKKNHTTAKAIAAANPGANSSKLKIGQKLQMPAGNGTAATLAPSPSPIMPESGDTTIYVVKSGDMLEKIAKRNGTTAKKIMAANNMKTTMIKPGQKLKLPAKTAAGGEPATSSGYVTPLSSGTNPAPTP